MNVTAALVRWSRASNRRRLVEVVLPTGPGRGHVRVDVDTDGFVDVQVSREDSDR